MWWAINTYISFLPSWYWNAVISLQAMLDLLTLLQTETTNEISVLLTLWCFMNPLLRCDYTIHSKAYQTGYFINWSSHIKSSLHIVDLEDILSHFEFNIIWSHDLEILLFIKIEAFTRLHSKKPKGGGGGGGGKVKFLNLNRMIQVWVSSVTGNS